MAISYAHSTDPQNDQNWALHGRDNWEQRFSPINQVNSSNVDQLELTWVYDMGTYRGLQATPLMINGVLYVSGTWGKVHAIDARSGAELWRFDPNVPGKWGRYGCCDVVNRGVAFWKGLIYVASFDARLFALDASTGEIVWEVDTINGAAPYTSTGAPRVVLGKVLIGNAGADYGVRGFLTAYDAKTGEKLWRFYTVPGNPNEPFEHSELEIAANTWQGSRWWLMGGGGTVWDSMAYDPDLNLLYFGVGNGSPWPQAIRSPGGGDNLFLSSIVAVDPDSGKMAWYYQTTPGESLDFTATQNIVLADLRINGEIKHVLMQAPKNGFFYVLDRETGKLISANNYVQVNWASHVDLESGRPVRQKVFGSDPELTQPSPAGGHNWQPMAYNPATGLTYIPARETTGLFALSSDWTNKKEIAYLKNWWNIGVDWKTYTRLAENTHWDVPSTDFGFLGAWDPIRSEYQWSYQHKNVINGGVLTTGGNLVFQGAGDGIFRAHNAKTGAVMWSKDLQTGVIAPPITYTIDGEQHIAVLAGWGGSAIAAGNPETSPATTYGNLGKLFAFKLGGEKKLPRLPERKKRITSIIERRIDEEAVELGATLYMQYCSLCHGARAISSGIIPDLRMMSETTHNNFELIVLSGTREPLGMPNFDDLLNKNDINFIYQYLIHRSRTDLKKMPGESLRSFR